MASLKRSKTHRWEEILSVRDAGKTSEKIKYMEGGDCIRVRQGCRYGMGANEPAVNVDNGAKEVVCK